jgi:hypothetical protein
MLSIIKEIVLTNAIYNTKTLETYDLNRCQVLMHFEEIKNVSYEMIKKNGILIKHVKKPIYKMKENAIKQNGYSIVHIKDLSEEHKLLAVKCHPKSIRYIDHPSINIVNAALERDGTAILFVEDQTEEMQILAALQDWYAL